MTNRREEAMQKLTMDNVVGFVLAILFALVIGFSMWALLVGDYMNTPHERCRRRPTYSAHRRIRRRPRRARDLVGAEFCRETRLRRPLPVRLLHLRGGVLQLRRIASVHLHSRAPIRTSRIGRSPACILPRSTTSIRSCWICCCRRARPMPLSPRPPRSSSPCSGRAKPKQPTSDLRSDLSGAGPFA